MEKYLKILLENKTVKIISMLSIRVIIILLIYLILKRLIKKIFTIKVIDQKRKATIVSLFNNFVKYTLIIFLALFILDAFGIETKAIVASLGVAGLVIGLSLQDIIKDFIAGMFIILENQYGIGDHVTIGDFKGKVISLGLKTTKLESYVGEIKTIPNRYVDQAINHSVNKQKIAIDITVPIDYDVSKTEKLLEEVLINTAKELKNTIGEVKLIGINAMTHFVMEFRIKVEVSPSHQEYVRNKILFNAKNVLNQHKDDLKLQ